jgi:hypothetical protein
MAYDDADPLAAIDDDVDFAEEEFAVVFGETSVQRTVITAEGSVVSPENLVGAIADAGVNVRERGLGDQLTDYLIELLATPFKRIDPGRLASLSAQGDTTWWTEEEMRRLIGEIQRKKFVVVAREVELRVFKGRPRVSEAPITTDDAGKIYHTIPLQLEVISNSGGPIESAGLFLDLAAIADARIRKMLPDQITRPIEVTENTGMTVGIAPKLPIGPPVEIEGNRGTEITEGGEIDKVLARGKDSPQGSWEFFMSKHDRKAIKQNLLLKVVTSAGCGVESTMKLTATLRTTIPAAEVFTVTSPNSVLSSPVPSQ